MTAPIPSLAAVLAGLTLFASAPGDARARPDVNRAYRHDPGFFMRLSGGFGFSAATFDDELETTLKGAGGMASLAFGGMVAPNIAVNVDIFGLSMVEPSIEQRGNDLGQAEGTRASVAGFGLGGTFYVMPANMYFAGSIGMGVGTVESRFRIGPTQFNLKEDSEPGLAINLMIGKEWWLSRKWGIGVAGQAIFSNLETDEGTSFGVMGFGLLFSASMN